jgi:DNA-binding SARP family transcriptional activator
VGHPLTGNSPLEWPSEVCITEYWEAELNVCPRVDSHANLSVGILGQLIVMRDGVRSELPASRKTRGLLAYLALMQRPCRREELCDLLWEGAADPRSELRWSLAKIKLAVGTWLKTSTDGVEFISDGLSVDSIAMRSLALQPMSEQRIAQALSLWRGPPLLDVEVRGQQAFQTWLAAERDSLAALRTNLLKSAVDLAWARPEDALSAARRLVAAEPWNEWGHARVVQLLERCGRVGEAADYASTMRQRLSKELGVAGARLLVAPPPPAAILTCAPRQVAQSELDRPVVKVEPLKLAPFSDDVAGLGLRVTGSLNAALWRKGTCVVIDDDTPRNAADETTSAGFAVRGAVAGEKSSTQVSLRCVDLHSGAVVWSDQIELGDTGISGLHEWLERAVESIGVAVHSASTESDNIDRDKTEARPYAASATQGGANPPKLTMIATARTLTGERRDAETPLRRSLQLERAAPEARIRSGRLSNYAEDAWQALRHFRAAIRLTSLDPDLFNALGGLEVAHFIEGDHMQAIRRMEQALALNPKAIWIYRNLFPAHIAAGEEQKAEAGICALIYSYPELTVTDVTGSALFSPPVMAKIAEGLRAAGLAP